MQKEGCRHIVIKIHDLETERDKIESIIYERLDDAIKAYYQEIIDWESYQGKGYY